MPDADGKIKGAGWSRSYEDAYDRVFGRVPSERAPEVEHLADRTAAEADGWSPEDYDQRRSAWRTWE